MRLQKSAVIDTGTRRMVEMMFADDPEPSQNMEMLSFRASVAPGGSPPLSEAHLEALRRVRNIMGEEIQRLERMRGRDDEGARNPA